jgi:diaminohydroxyphosphoribosylaminopyrimidine deaminase/5-amino-6-(5-phosphoribosylamino)uracil reductase
VQTSAEAPVIVATAAPPDSGLAAELRRRGCEVLALSADAGRPSVAALLDELGRRRMTNVLVEGGSAVLGSFLDADAVDEVHVFIAPKVFGGAEAKTPVGGRGVDAVARALAFPHGQVETIEGDVLFHGWR